MLLCCVAHGVSAAAELGSFEHACEGELVCQNTQPDIPHFNAPVYFENMTEIGKVDEIFGSLTEARFTVKLGQGFQAATMEKGMKIFVNPMKLLPLDRFKPRPASKVRAM